MAHVGKLYPVAFRRDLNLRSTRNTDYLGRCWFLGFQLCAGTLGTALNAGRFTDLNEGTPAAGMYSTFRGGPFVEAGRTFSLEMSIGPGVVEYLAVSVKVIDSALGILATFRRDLNQGGIYNNLLAEGKDSANPHPLILRTNDPACYALPRVVRWAEYNVLHP